MGDYLVCPTEVPGDPGTATQLSKLAVMDDQAEVEVPSPPNASGAETMVAHTGHANRATPYPPVSTTLSQREAHGSNNADFESVEQPLAGAPHRHTHPWTRCG